MRSRHDGLPPGVDRALAEGLCGIGGIVEPAPDDLDDAVARLAALYGDRLAARLRRFAGVPDGAFVWTRDDEGRFRLGRLTGAWRYDDSAAARAVDLVHVRDCTWLAGPVSDTEVPAGTLRTFGRGGRNFQRTHDAGVSEQTRAVWEARAQGSVATRSPACTRGPV
ncbi:GAF domain-containing protein [Pseudonocardia bannensis]|uniref:GAF domain-containing protein n=2 Tax=Pseudonocardia bannensis TaxID=630973 RepID=A0A848DR58_9PSEU|nr:GAF domain-containing protein [Pseudonocardia bannensis]